MTDGRTRWVATVTGSGMEPFEVVAESREELERELGDLIDLHVGQPRWIIEERSAQPAKPSGTRDQPTDQQLHLNL